MSKSQPNKKAVEEIRKFIKKASIMFFLHGLFVSIFRALLLGGIAGLGIAAFQVTTGSISQGVSRIYTAYITLAALVFVELYTLFKTPKATDIVRIIDYRCKLQSRLVSAWEFKGQALAFLPALLEDLLPRLKKIKTKEYINFRVNKKAFTIFCSTYLILSMHFFLSKSISSDKDNKELAHVSERMNTIAGALGELEKNEGVRVSNEDIGLVKNIAKKLKETSKLLSSGEITKEDAAKKINKLKEEIKSKSPVGEENVGNAQGAMDRMFYELMDKLDNLKVFDKPGILRDIFNILSAFEAKFGANKPGKLANNRQGKKSKINISTKKTKNSKTIYVSHEMAKELGMLFPDKDKKEKGENKEQKSKQKLINYYSTYIGSIDSRKELSFTEKKLIIEYFEKIKKLTR